MKNHSKKISAAFAATMILASTLSSSARPDTRYISCHAAKGLVNSYGAIILGTSAHRYDKYVKNHAYCNRGQHIVRAYVPTADSRRCNVGYKCAEFIKDD